MKNYSKPTLILDKTCMGAFINHLNVEGGRGNNQMSTILPPRRGGGVQKCPNICPRGLCMTPMYYPEIDIEVFENGAKEASINYVGKILPTLASLPHKLM